MTALADAPTLTMDRDEAREHWRAYRAAEKCGAVAPGDHEAAQAFYHLAQGRTVLHVDEVMKHGGLDDTGRPRLAIARATARWCGLQRAWDGWRFSSCAWPSTGPDWTDFDFGARRRDVWAVPTAYLKIPDGGRHIRRAMVPTVPPAMRPRHGLGKLLVLWEAEWEPVPPVDPFLLRRIGRTRMCVVLAHWDLTDLERTLLCADRLASGAIG